MVTDQYPPFVGGVARHVLLVKTELEKRGHTITVLTTDFGKKKVETNVYTLPSVPFPLRRLDPMVIPFNPELESKLEKLPFDIVHNHLFMSGFMGLRIAKKKTIPSLVTLHLLFNTYVNWILPFPKTWYPFTDRVARYYFNKHDAVDAPSTKAYKELQRLHLSAELKLIYNGINLPDPRNVNENLFFDTFHVDKKDPLIAIIGRIDPEKNVDLTVKAVAKVRMKIPNIKLAIVGDGQLRPQVEKVVDALDMRKSVLFTGYVDQAMVASINKASQIILFASVGDTLPTVLIEGMSLEKPIIAVNDLAIVDLVHNKKNGIIVNKSADEMAEGIITLLEDDKLRLQYGKASYEFSKAFSIQNHVDNLENFYRELIEKKKRSIK